MSTATAPVTKPPLPEGYTLHTSLPAVPAYRHLRASAGGLTPVSEAQAAGAVANSWYGVHIRFTPPTTPPSAAANSEEEKYEVVGMGRVIGDGGWYFHIADMAVLPAHQRKGLGGAVLRELLAYIELHRPHDGSTPYISLFADPPGRGLYLKNSFVDGTDVNEVGMVYTASVEDKMAEQKKKKEESSA